jgi:hypothetical protein
LTAAALVASPAAGYSVLERVSGGNTPTGNAAQPAAFAEVSIDGERQLFDTKEQLASTDADASTDIYMRAPGSVTLMSAGQIGGNGAHDALFATVSEDGARVLFHTREALVSADTDAQRYDVYQRFGGTTTLISTGPSTTNANVDAFLRGASPDGTRVFFETSEVLTATDTDTRTDVYQRASGTTTQLSIGPTSAIGQFTATFRGASLTGGRVFFETTDRLVSTDLDSATDVYQRTAGTTTLISTGPDGGNGAVTASFDGTSDDGTRVFFHTTEQLVTTDTDGFYDVYEREAATTTLHSTGPNGGNGPKHADYVANSADGLKVIFETDESLLAADTDIYVDLYQRTGGVTTQLSTGPSGGNGAFDATAVAVSDDATRVLFDTKEKLTADDTDANFFDVYRREAGVTKLISTNSSGASGAFDAFFAGLSDDGDIVFDTKEKLAAADTDSSFDTYVYTEVPVFGSIWTLASKGPHAGNGAFDVTFAGMTPDGNSIFLHSNEKLASDDTDSVQDVYRAMFPGPGQVRPQGASPMSVSLVPAYNACAFSNRLHGAPLSTGSCAPPVQASTSVTIGTPDATGGPPNFIGRIVMRVQPGGLGLPEDSNVEIVTSLTDLRCKVGTSTCGAANAAGGADYTGQLQVKLPMQITDRFNSTTTGGGTDPATMVANSLDFTLGCTGTASTAEGSDCALTTTANAITPGLVLDTRRAMWELGQISVMDGGPDGTVSTATGNKAFARQGFFIP